MFWKSKLKNLMVCYCPCVKTTYNDLLDCFNQNRVAKFGELAPECVHTYYKYGCALLYKAQEEADPLADVPKKESESQQGSTKDGSVKNSVAESSTASVCSNVEQDVNSNNQDAALDDGQYVISSVY